MRAIIILNMTMATCLFTGCGSESSDQYRGLPTSNTWAGPAGAGSSATSWGGGSTTYSPESRTTYVNNPFEEQDRASLDEFRNKIAPGVTTQVDRSSLDRITPGVTTQAEAERILGQPKRTTTPSDGSKACFYPVWLRTSSTSPGGSNYSQTLTTLEVAYDRDGKVVGVKRHFGTLNLGGQPTDGKPFGPDSVFGGFVEIKDRPEKSTP